MVADRVFRGTTSFVCWSPRCAGAPFVGAKHIGPLFYLDPPYWETEGYGVPFDWEQYVAMADLMRTISGKAILSINDHPAIRECFAGFHVREVPISYTVGGGGKAVQRVELIYSSWDVEADPVSLF